MGHLQGSKPEVQQVPYGGCVPVSRLLRFSRSRCSHKDWLFVGENNPRTGRKAVTVAMFSREFQKWSGESWVSPNGATWLDSVGMTDLSSRLPTAIASQSKVPHYAHELSVGAQQTPPSSPPTKGFTSRVRRAFSRTPSKYINHSPPVLPLSSGLHLHPSQMSSRPSSIALAPTPTFDATSLLRRFSMPSPYTGGNSATGQPAAHPMDPASQANNQVHDPVVAPANTVHEYNLMSRGRNYALVTVMSRAANGQDPPLLYFGEELGGFIVLSQNDLESMGSMDVVVSCFPNVGVIVS
jgi:hypothetical protein